MDNLSADLPKILSMFGLAFFYFWPSIPAGLALGLSPVTVILTSALSYACGVAVVTLLGERVRDWILKRLGRKTNPDPNSRFHRLVERYGVVGLGLLSPMTVGAQIGAALGLAFRMPTRRLTLAMMLGGLAWSIVLTGAVTLGILGIQSAQ